MGRFAPREAHYDVNQLLMCGVSGIPELGGRVGVSEPAQADQLTDPLGGGDEYPLLGLNMRDGLEVKGRLRRQPS